MRFITAFGIALGLTCLTQANEEGVRPNVILIMADDLGYNDLGCYGHPEIKTPVLDKLASEGVRLTNFHSGSTVCTPSRMALMTGAYPVRLGWTQGVAGYLMGRRDGMSPDALTIAEIFKSEGYATGISGKWHIGDMPETRPHAQGFDFNYFIPLSNNQTKVLMRDDEVVEKPFENRLLTEQFTREAISFIKQTKGKPFFLYLPYTAPHFPVEPHPDWLGKSSFKKEGKREGEYGDVIEEMDYRIGEIVEVLKESGMYENTIIVFTSDNGAQGGEGSRNDPYRGKKWSPLEGGTRVPCIISWPGKVKAGVESDALLAAIDILPTLSTACGIDWKSKSKGNPVIDGENLWNTFAGYTPDKGRSGLLHWQGKDKEPQAYQEGDWKIFFDRRDALEGPGVVEKKEPYPEVLVKYRDGLKEKGPNPPFLFDLSSDPSETIDLSEKNTDQLAALKVSAEKAITILKSSPPMKIFKAEKGK